MNDFVKHVLENRVAAFKEAFTGLLNSSAVEKVEEAKEAMREQINNPEPKK